MMKRVVLVALLASVVGCATNPSPEPTPGSKTCGSFAGNQCAANEICVFPQGAQCGAADQEGTCEVVPADCSALDGAPVCGCDGHVYPTVCDAKAAHQNVDGANTCR